MQQIKSMFIKLLPLILIGFLVFIYFGRLFVPRSQIFMIPDFGESDVLHLNLPFKNILSQSLKNHTWPLWSHLLASGFPILAEGQIGTFYIPNLVLFRFLPLITAYNLNLGLSFILAGFGTYLFLNKLRLSKTASLWGAVVFSFSGFFGVHLNHFNLIQAASLLPLLYWDYLLLLSKPSLKYSVLGAFILSQQFFTGHFYIVFISLIGLIIIQILLIISGWRKNFRAILLKYSFFVCLSLIISFLFSAIQFFPTWELWQLSSRQTGLNFNTITAYPYPFKHLATFINPYLFGNPAIGTYPSYNSEWGIFWENTAYMGVVTILLAIISLIYIKNRIVKTGLILLFISLLLVLGKNSPLYFIFAIFPFSLFRVPSKYLLLLVFSITLLSSYLIDKIFNIPDLIPKKIRTMLRYFLVILFFLLFIADEFNFSYKYPPISKATNWTTKPEILKYFFKSDAKILSIGSTSSWNDVFLKDGWKDITPFIFLRNGLYPNYSSLFNITNMQINTGGLIPRRLSALIDFTRDFAVDEKNKIATPTSFAKNIMAVSGVNYVVSPYAIISDNLVKVGTQNSDQNFIRPFYVYELTKSRPRFYIASVSKKVKTIEDIYKSYSENNNSYQNVLVEKNELLVNNKTNSTDKVKIIQSTDTDIDLETESGENNLLVTSDTYYPGWYATVDNRPVEIYLVNLSQRVIELPKGTRYVKMEYKPQSFETGKTISFISYIIVFAVLFLFYGIFPHKDSGNKKPSSRF